MICFLYGMTRVLLDADHFFAFFVPVVCVGLRFRLIENDR